MSQKYLQKKANGSIVVTKARADEVKLFLQGKGRKQDKTFTHWVKRRKFQLINYPALGLSNILCTPVTEKVKVTHVIVCTNTITLYYIGILVLVKGQHDTTPLGSYKQVAEVEDFFDILHQAHYNDTGHSGAKKTLAKASPANSDILCTQVKCNADCTLYRFRLCTLACQGPQWTSLSVSALFAKGWCHRATESH